MKNISNFVLNNYKKMKKIIGLSLFTVLALASCKKEYNCTCTTFDGDTVVHTLTEVIKSKEHSKEADCDAVATPGEGYTTVCEIK